MGKFLSIDVESTGLDPLASELLELGIVVFDTEIKFKQKATNSLRVVFCKEQIQGNIFAINMNIDLLNEINKYNSVFKKCENEGYIIVTTPALTTIYVNVTPVTNSDNFFSFTTKTAINRTCELIKKFIVDAGVEGKYNIAGKNYVGFDKAFLCKYNQLEDLIVKNSRHRVLDIGSMYVQADDEVIPNLAECLKRAGLPTEVPHTAVEDAILVVKAAQYKFGTHNEEAVTDGTNYIDIPGLEQVG